VEGGGGSAFLPPAWQPPVVIEPDNGAAVAGFVTSVVSAALLVMSFGFLGVLTLIAAPFAIHYSRKGKRAVREGRTRKHAGLAQAGFVIGIIVLVLSLLATVAAILFIVGIAGDHPFHHHNGGGGEGFESTSAGLVT
jgi:predicted metal-binding membrane protein